MYPKSREGRPGPITGVEVEVELELHPSVAEAVYYSLRPEIGVAKGVSSLISWNGALLSIRIHSEDVFEARAVFNSHLRFIKAVLDSLAATEAG